MQDTILGLDIGTTATKAVLFDLTGADLLKAEQSYPLSTPQPGWAEQDPDRVWQAVVSVIRQVVNQAGPERQIVALALAAQSGSLIPARADGAPVYPMITWLDTRSEVIIKQWQAEGVEAGVRSASGWGLHPGLPLPNIAWLRRFRPDTFAETELFLGVLDFLNHRLTGAFCTDLSAGAEMQLIDVSTARWSPHLCDLVGITPNHLARLQPAGTIVGKIKAEVSRLTGLAPHTVVVNGGHDQCCTALAMGMTGPGQVMLATGTAWVLTGVVETPATETIPPPMDLNFHVAPQRWTISQLLGGFGAAVEWYLQQCWPSTLSRTGRYAHFDEALAHSKPGCHGLFFLPLGGSEQLPADRPQGGFVGLRLDHTRVDMSRAVLEGAAFELRWTLDKIKQAGLPVEHLWVAGGATQSPVWPQILADVGGVPIWLTQYAQWPALGAAILAGVGAGLFETLEAGIARFQKSPRQIAPAESLAHFYGECFAAYQQLVQRLA
ncbi:MAG: FGGY family carbohydrate kinase [Chloroflexota bacterium]